MALHEQSVGKSDEWYTPRRVFDALGVHFDLDVASPFDRRFCCVPASRFLSCDALGQDWDGFVWMNAPFGGRNGLVPWLDRFFSHGDGIALVPDRTSAPWWQSASRRSDAVLFVDGKLRFIDQDGNEGKSPAQGTCLMASGSRAISALVRAQAAGLGQVKF